MGEFWFDIFYRLGYIVITKTRRCTLTAQELKELEVMFERGAGYGEAAEILRQVFSHSELRPKLQPDTFHNQVLYRFHVPSEELEGWIQRVSEAPRVAGVREAIRG